MSCPLGRCDGSGWIAAQPILGYREDGRIPADLHKITVVPCPQCNRDGLKNPDLGTALKERALEANAR